IVTVARKRVCSSDREQLQPSDQFAESYEIGLRLTKKGCRKVVTKYRGIKAYCPTCERLHLPPMINRLSGRLFRPSFQAWAVYQRVVLRLSYRQITATMEDMFCERTSASTVIKFVRNLADFYGRCEKANLDRLLAGPFLHVDETRLSIQGT